MEIKEFKGGGGVILNFYTFDKNKSKFIMLSHILLNIFGFLFSWLPQNNWKKIRCSSGILSEKKRGPALNDITKPKFIYMFLYTQ